MASDTELHQAETRFDDFTGFKVAEILLGKIAEFAPDLEDGDGVWAAFIEWAGEERREYFEAIRRTGHSVFYYDLQALYEFGCERTGRDDLAYLAGIEFSATAYAENLSRLLQVALESRDPFPRALEEVFRGYLIRYTGTRYLLGADIAPDETVFSISSREPELSLLYCRQYGLDPVRAFRHSFLYIAGAMSRLFERVIAGFDVKNFHVEPQAGRGLIRIPITASSRFDFDGMTQTLVGYTRRLEDRRADDAEDQKLQSDLIAESELMWETWERVRRAGRSDEILLLRGESGTGKSFIARKIHELSHRRDMPFVEVCLASDIGSENMIQSDLFGHEKGAFTGAGEEKKGLFQLADGGTIFLDEIGDASAELQAKLLRVIGTSTFRRLGGTRDITVNVRAIAATNRDLEQVVAEGSFRRDLYFRLSVIPLELPPLRERREDIPVLARFLYARATRGRTDVPRMEPELPARLSSYDWPGNIRELDHAMKYAVAMAKGGVITVVDLPAAVRSALELAGAEEAPQPNAAQPKTRGARSVASRLVDCDALRDAVRSLGEDLVVPPIDSHEVPAHVDYARRAWLGILIDELGGDLLRIGKLWDRGSEKTLRKTIRAFGLAHRLDVARARRAKT